MNQIQSLKNMFINEHVDAPWFYLVVVHFTLHHVFFFFPVERYVMMGGTRSQKL